MVMAGERFALDSEEVLLAAARGRVPSEKTPSIGRFTSAPDFAKGPFE
jgi:hypothetical protein